jgi:hypothetical protein
MKTGQVIREEMTVEFWMRPQSTLSNINSLFELYSNSTKESFM